MGRILEGHQQSVGATNVSVGVGGQGRRRSGPYFRIPVQKQAIQRVVRGSATKPTERMERGRPLARSFTQEPVELGLAALDVFRMHGVLADQRLCRRGADRGFRVIQRGEQRIERVVARCVGQEPGSHAADARIRVDQCRHEDGPNIGRGLEAA